MVKLKMTHFEKSWLATAGIMVFGVLFAAQIFYVFLGVKWSIYFQMALAGFWLGFSVIQRRKHHGKED